MYIFLHFVIRHTKKKREEMNCFFLRIFLGIITCNPRVGNRCYIVIVVLTFMISMDFHTDIQ